MLLVGAACASLTSFAAEKVLLETPVKYSPNASVVEPVRRECKIEDMIVRNVGTALSKRNADGKGTIGSGDDAGDAGVVRVQITNVFGVGGGAYSGPKAISVDAEMLKNGKVVRQVHLRRSSLGGFWGGFKGTCSILQRCAVTLGKDIASWVDDPSFKGEGEPDGKDTVAAKDSQGGKTE